VRVELGSEAEAELDEGTERYLAEGLDHGVDHAWELAERFVDEVERSMALIAERPTLYAEVEPGVRQVLLHKFPYSLLYTVESDHVFVLAVMHQSRSPGYWRGRRR
jgi:toxin ParE1/3/4